MTTPSPILALVQDSWSAGTLLWESTSAQWTKEFYEWRLKVHGGKCPICGDSERPRILDHEHKPGQTHGPIRDVLCSRCNSRLAIVEHGGVRRWDKTSKQYVVYQPNHAFDSTPYTRYIKQHRERIMQKSKSTKNGKGNPLTIYITDAQKEKLRALAGEKETSIKEITGASPNISLTEMIRILIDTAVVKAAE